MFTTLLQRWTILNANGATNNNDSPTDNKNSASFKFKTK